MSQENIREVLLELGGEGDINDISESLNNCVPESNLGEWLDKQLDLMKSKGFVEPVGDQDSKWRLTKEGYKNQLIYPVREIDAIVTEAEFSKKGFEVANIATSLPLNVEINLSALDKDLPNTSYNPESYSSLVYQPFQDKSIRVLVPTSGNAVVVGAKSKNELIRSIGDFISNIQGLGISTNADIECVNVQNIVANYDFEQEFDLNTVAVALSFNSVEYEPEQFPGLIYQTQNRNITILIFSSGKIVITGAKTYLEIVQTEKTLRKKLNGILNLESELVEG